MAEISKSNKYKFLGDKQKSQTSLLAMKMLATMYRSHENDLEQINILLVDDDEDDYLFVKEALAQCQFKYSLTWIQDSEQVIPFLEEAKANQLAAKVRPDLILLDINMPKKNGFDILSEIQNHDSLEKLLVVLLTSSKREEDINKAYDLGAYSYITKSSDFNRMVESLDSLLKFWFDIVQRPKLI